MRKLRNEFIAVLDENHPSFLSKLITLVDDPFVVSKPPLPDYESRIDERAEKYSQSFGHVSLETFINENQKPRLKNARSYLMQDVINVPLALGFYSAWRDYDEYLVLHRDKSVGFEQKTIAIKCSKRGNDVYGRRTEKKLGFLKESENLEFFKPKDFDYAKPVMSPLLWLTLTWNSKLCSLREAWDSLEYYYNLFITNLRNRYGRIRVVRFPQASPDEIGLAYGYPHLHLVLLFEDKKFTVFPSMNEKGEPSYRIVEKDELVKQGNWHSFVDVKAIRSMNGIYNYAVKHYENAGFGTSKEATLNNALCWLFGKKSYTISGAFRKTYSEFIRSLRNSKAKMAQLDLNGGVHSQVWHLVGLLQRVFSIFELREAYPDLVFGRKWVVELPFCAWDWPEKPVR